MWAGGAPTRVTVTAAGWYRVVVAAFSNGSAYTTDGWALFKNGVSGIAQGTGSYFLGEAGAFSLAASDYLELLWVRVTATGVTTQSTGNGSSSLVPGNPSGTGGNFGALLVQYLGA
jgi:hypothetical protein